MWGSARLVVMAAVAFAALAAASAPAPAISVKPAAADFGPTPVGATKSKTFDVKLDTGYAFGGFSGGATAPPFATAAVCSGNTCKVTESFHPTAIGTYEAVLTIPECRPWALPCVLMHLPIRGVGGVFTAKAIDLGSVAVHRTKSKTFTIKLDAGHAIGALSGSGGEPPFAASSARCGAGSCKIAETFAPLVPGDLDAELSLSECPVTGGACNTIAVAVAARAR